MNGPPSIAHHGPRDAIEWPHEHPPRFGCGCESCHAWIVVQSPRASLAPGRTVPDVIGRWWRIYRPLDVIPNDGRWP